MTGMDDLVTFLRAQLDDDERVVLQLNAAPGGVYLEPETPDVNTMNLGAYLMRWPPKRMLAEIGAKRASLDQLSALGIYLDGAACSHPGIRVWIQQVLKLLALPYADRNGYRAEWRP